MANDLWHDMKVLNSLYQELMWDNDDEIQFRMASGNIDDGTFKLYGIKDS